HRYEFATGKGDNDNNAFRIKEDQLEIKKSPDYETKSDYRIRLQSTDAGGLSYSEAFSLIVNDLEEQVSNENSPQETTSQTLGKPIFASIEDAEIVLIFPIELKDSEPSKRRFRITVNDVLVKISAISLEPEQGLVFISLAETPAPGAAIKVSYADLKGDQSSGVIEAQDGTDATSFNDFDVANDLNDTEAPGLVSAEVAGNELSLAFDEAINQDQATLPSPASFKLKVNRRKASIKGVSGGSTQGIVNLELKDTFDFKDKLTLSYRDLKFDQVTGVIQDVAGNDLLSFSNVDVVNNNVDPTTLGVLSSYIFGKSIELNFNRELANLKPLPSAFRVYVDGANRKVKSVDVLADERQVLLELKKAVTSDQSVQLTYTDLAGNQNSKVIEDNQGNDLSSFADLPVVNDTEDHTPLSLDLAEMIEDDRILLTFNKLLDQTQPSASRFRILVGNKRNKVSSVEMAPEDGQIILSLKKPISDGDTILFNYADLAGDQKRKVIQEVNGIDLETVSSFSVENSIELDSQPPSLDGAVFINKQITLDFSEELASGKVKNSRFKVSVDGKRYKVSSIEVPEADTIVNVVLGKKIDPDASVLLNYKDPKKDQKKGVIEDLAGNDVETFINYTVEPISGVDGASLRMPAAEDPLSVANSGNPAFALSFSEGLAPI
ncbi:MAG: SwmB domain-containing protein, partial [Prochlorococcus sp.]